MGAAWPASRGTPLALFCVHTGLMTHGYHWMSSHVTILVRISVIERHGRFLANSGEEVQSKASMLKSDPATTLVFHLITRRAYKAIRRLAPCNISHVHGIASRVLATGNMMRYVAASPARGTHFRRERSSLPLREKSSITAAVRTVDARTQEAQPQPAA